MYSVRRVGFSTNFFGNFFGFRLISRNNVRFECFSEINRKVSRRRLKAGREASRRKLKTGNIELVGFKVKSKKKKNYGPTCVRQWGVFAHLKTTILVEARGNTYTGTALARRIRADTLCTRICIICKNSEMKERRDVSAKAALKGAEGEGDERVDGGGVVRG